jgi:hypothetical protein
VVILGSSTAAASGAAPASAVSVTPPDGLSTPGLAGGVSLEGVVLPV